MSNGNDIIMGSGGPPAASFATIGTRVGGTVVAEPTSRQQTDPNTGDLKTFSSGDPMMVAIVQVQTDIRDPNNPNDDGIRSLWVGGRALKVVAEACRRVGSPQGVEVGGYLALTYVGDEAPSGRGLRGAKIYTAEYRKPNAFATHGEPGPETYQPAQTGYVAPNTVTYNTQPAAASTSAIPAGALAGVTLTDEQKDALRAIGMPV